MDFDRLFKNWDDRQTIDAGSTIFRADDPADAIYAILSGSVQLFIKDKLLGTENAGGIIGEMVIINSSTHNLTAVALTPVVLAKLDLDQFKQFIKTQPDFSLHAMAALAQRLRTVDGFISEQMD
ncbi:MAG: cyclic nucleotide-binding domain-containing protein [Lysobacterales bacterium]